MGWFAHPQGFWYEPPVYFAAGVHGNIDFNLNDAGLCVKEMQKHGDWEHDFMDFVAGSQRWNYHQCIAWLFNADNFFEAMAKWLQEQNTEHIAEKQGDFQVKEEE